jgi:hypothetical protein
MDKSELVERDINEGRRLVEALDKANFPLPAAYWFFLPTLGVWQLRFSSPAVKDEGPRHAYAIVQTALATASPAIDIDLDSISVVPESDPIATELRISVGTDGKPYIGGKSISNTIVGELFVHSIYVYRAERIVGISGETTWSMAIPEKINGRTVWRKKDARLIFNKGYTADVKAENHEVKKHFTKNGVNTTFHIFTRIKNVGNKAFGDLQRVVILDGRLRSIEDIAANVEISN